MTASSQLPEAQEQALDEYPMPDEQVSTPDMQEYGYSYDGMLPVTRERALELDAAGLTVYVLHEDNTESMVFDPQEIVELRAFLPFLGIFLAIIIIVQTVIALGLRLVLNELQVGKYLSLIHI